MELANRLDLESTLAGKLSRLYGSHRRKIAAALKATRKGNDPDSPPDPSKIPSSLWSQIEDETEQQLAEEILVIYLLVIAATSDDFSLGLTSKTQDSMGSAYASSRAKEMARAMTANSRERIEAGSDPFDVFSPDRASTVARTEVGVAQSTATLEAVKSPAGEKDRKAEDKRQSGGGEREGGQGGESEADKKAGKIPAGAGDRGTGKLEDDEEDEEDNQPPSSGRKSDAGQGKGQPPKEKPKRLPLVAYWRHSHLRPKGHAGAAVNPCKICTPMLDRPESQWGGLIPGAAHPHCDCYVEWVALNNTSFPSAN